MAGVLEIVLVMVGAPAPAPAMNMVGVTAEAGYYSYRLNWFVFLE